MDDAQGRQFVEDLARFPEAGLRAGAMGWKCAVQRRDPPVAVTRMRPAQRHDPLAQPLLARARFSHPVITRTRRAQRPARLRRTPHAHVNRLSHGPASARRAHHFFAFTYFKMSICTA